MIRVERIGPVPESLVNQQGAGGKLEGAIAAYTNYFKRGRGLPQVKKVFEFTRYNEKDVKEALHKMFHGKCAYCESKISYATNLDVEHYRPKSRVQQDREDARGLHGYYWLAWDWDNLLPACPQCNRWFTHDMPDIGEIALGKKNLFPLADDSKRVTHHDDRDKLERETPLLLHPCDDEPAVHIEFTNEGVIRSALLPGGMPSKIGETSIEVYALHRPNLTIERGENAREIERQIERVKSQYEYVIKYPDDPKFRSELKEEMKILKSFMLPEKRYSQMARQIIARYAREFGFPQV
ncbi:hypothetical protein ACIROD_15915 [Peribacillus sp. NPDC101481]|uniref:hypothetical protein n=1 Tax=Peribacillus sp. NPDC101481 TaxID=3364403 RepID=UPI0038103818